MEMEAPAPNAPTHIDQHQISQMRTQIGRLADDVRELARLVQTLLDAEAERKKVFEEFAEQMRDDRGVVMQAASMMRDIASRLERQTEAIGHLTSAANGVLDLSVRYDQASEQDQP
jgi:methyl-accepting chemotaxis protein